MLSENQRRLPPTQCGHIKKASAFVCMNNTHSYTHTLTYPYIHMHKAVRWQRMLCVVQSFFLVSIRRCFYVCVLYVHVCVCVLSFKNKNISLYLYITFVRLLSARCAIKTGNVRLTSTEAATVAVAASDPDTCQHLGRAIFGVSEFRFCLSLFLPFAVSVCLWLLSLGRVTRKKQLSACIQFCFYYYCYNFLLFCCVCLCVCVLVCVCTSVFGTLAARLSHNFYILFSFGSRFLALYAPQICRANTQQNRAEQNRTAHTNRKILNLIFQMMCEWLRPDIR